MARGKEGVRIGVAAYDRVRGREFLDGGGVRVVTASLVKVDILVALLLRGGLSAVQEELAGAMIRHSDNDSATALWRDAGAADGLAALYRRLGMTATVPAPDQGWGATMTGPADRLALLRVLTEPTSPLSPGGQDFVLNLMSQVSAPQRWGITVLAGPHDTTCMKNGWLPRARDAGTWTVNTMGRITGPGRDLLVAALSAGHPDLPTGIASLHAALPRLIPAP